MESSFDRRVTIHCIEWETAGKLRILELLSSEPKVLLDTPDNFV